MLLDDIHMSKNGADQRRFHFTPDFAESWAKLRRGAAWFATWQRQQLISPLRTNRKLWAVASWWAAMRLVRLNVRDRRFAQSPCKFCLPFTNAINWLFYQTNIWDKSKWFIIHLVRQVPKPHHFDQLLIWSIIILLRTQLRYSNSQLFFTFKQVQMFRLFY